MITETHPSAQIHRRRRPGKRQVGRCQWSIDTLAENRLGVTLFKKSNSRFEISGKR